MDEYTRLPSFTLWSVGTGLILTMRSSVGGLISSHIRNKVIGTRGQGVGVWCPRELTTEHLTEASLRLKEPLRGSASLRLDEPLRGPLAFS